MRYRFMAPFVALVAVWAWTHLLFAQGNPQTQAQKASAATPEAFDPHDISGIWKNPGRIRRCVGQQSSSHDGVGKREME